MNGIRSGPMTARKCSRLRGAAALLCAVTPANADRASPAWYDRNAIAAAPDWPYRVPINVPAASVISTIAIDVDFAAMLAQLNVNGAIDANSPRVVRASEALSTIQEFSAATGEVRFDLNDAGPVIYFPYRLNFGSNGGNAVSNTISVEGPCNGFDTDNLSGLTLGMRQARAGTNDHIGPRQHGTAIASKSCQMGFAYFRTDRGPFHTGSFHIGR